MRVDALFENVEETVSAAATYALGRENAIALDDFLTGQVFEARVTVDEKFGIGIEPEDEVLESNGFVAKDAQKRFVHLGMSEFVRPLEVGEGFLDVIRNHEAARGNGDVAARFGHFFQNQNVRTFVVCFDRSRCAGAAEADDDDVDRTVPLHFGRPFAGVGGGQCFAYESAKAGTKVVPSAT